MKPIRTEAAVEIDFARPGGVPLSKERIAIYNSGLVPIERYRRDADLLRRSRAESLRLDLGWGAEWMPWRDQPVTRELDGTIRYHFDETDELARLLADCGLRPYWSYCYVPIAARPEGGDWRGMAEDDSVWVDLVREYAGGAAGRGVEIGYHEVYNEPDLRDERTGQPHFYLGDLDDYLDLYRATATAIRDVDPHARIGGPALAVTSINRHWLKAFLTMVVEERLPLDFLSFHHYGAFSLENTLDIVDDVLAGFDGFRHLELHLNEYNSFQIDYPRGGLQDGHLLASSFAAELPPLLERRSLTRTSWAQFLDSGQGNFSGMIDIDGVAKPIFRVYEFFQAMPTDRAAVAIDAPVGVGALASSEPGRASVLLWNRHFLDVSVELDLAAAPATGTVTVLGPKGEAVEQVEGARLSIAIPTGGVALLELGGAAAAPGARRVSRSYLPRELARETGWCDIDEATVTFRLATEDGASVSCSADLLASDAPSQWTADFRGPDGGEVIAGAVIRVETSTAVSSIELGSGGTREPRWSLPDLPLRQGDARISVALVDAPAGTVATIRPGGAE